MIKRNVYKKIISILLVFSLLFSMASCGSSEQKTEPAFDSGATGSNDEKIDTVGINDSYVTLEIKGIENTPLSIDEIKAEDILVNCINVTNIDSIEIEFTSINDEFVHLAYDNFVSVYGDDFDLKDFLADVGIGAGCIIVYVTLSVAGGPVGTFFGAIITSQFTTSALVIGTAIDAAVSAYQAYQEGGDAAYIIGHVLNGVADGFKWSAILSPLAGLPDGIKTLRAVSELRKVPGFTEISDKEARKLFEQLATLIKQTDNVADEALKDLSKVLGDEFSDEVLDAIIKNKNQIVKIVRKFNPFNVADDVVAALREQFFHKAGLSDDAGKQLLKELKKGTINSLDDISDPAAREYIRQNFSEFVESCGNFLSKSFIDSCLKEKAGPEAYDLIKSEIKSSDLYFKLFEKVGKESANSITKDADTLLLIQLRYGKQPVTTLVVSRELYTSLQKDVISDEQLKKVITGIIDGSLHSFDDVSKINSQIARNMCISRNIVSSAVKSLDNEKALSGLLDDLAEKAFKNALSARNIPDVSDEFTKYLFSTSASKKEIIIKFGEDQYNRLVDNAGACINCLKIQVKTNKTLIQELAEDSLRKKGIKENLIQNILSGKSITEWDVAKDKVFDIMNIVAEYYSVTDDNRYHNYVREVAEFRGEYISEFLSQYKSSGNTIRNSSYAGCIMEPAGANAAYIKAKYGDIYMNKQGFIILDDFAIDRVELPNLTGLESDITMANKVHHGATYSIPGYTWHHMEDGKTLILVPTELHEAYRHTGGADLLREGLSEAVENGAH